MVLIYSLSAVAHWLFPIGYSLLAVPHSPLTFPCGYSLIGDHFDKETAKELVLKQNREQYLAVNYPYMKLSDIKTLSKLITDEEISNYERDKGM